ncbi:hypothetical protein [Isoptericola croceus]|uniref:hypothetical protein n=1 Tax=Isoptericola croceus TaxID=3031406 RepID=UPI0023F9FF2C|nr:hypothetical protein [Isoptericola croceus]
MDAAPRTDEPSAPPARSSDPPGPGPARNAMMGVAFLAQAVVTFFFASDWLTHLGERLVAPAGGPLVLSAVTLLVFFGIFAAQFVVLALRRWHPVRMVSMATMAMVVVWSLASRAA